MTTLILEAPIRWWKCPSCGLTDRTQQAEPHTRFHACPALGNVTLPLVEVAGPDAHVKGRHRAVMREDYAGTANPVSAIVTERPDGSNDCTVLADTAIVHSNR